MSRVLITGGTSRLGAAVARLLLADPTYDVRISDQRPAPQWMREGCEVHSGDLRVAAEAATAAKGCSHLVHLACFAPARSVQSVEAEPQRRNGATASADCSQEQTGGRAEPDEHPHALLDYEGALHRAVVRAALDRAVERLVFVSSPLVFERAELFPSPEEHLQECLPPRSARGFARLAGERLCAAAARERGLQYAICRPFGAYGPIFPDQPDPPPEPGSPPRDLSQLIDRVLAGERPLRILGTPERTLTPTHVEDLAAGIVAMLDAPEAANEDFNLSSERELSLGELAHLARRDGAADGAPELTFEELPAREGCPPRSCPSARKARQLLGWGAQIDPEEGIAAIAAGRLERSAAAARTAAQATVVDG